MGATLTSQLQAFILSRFASSRSSRDDAHISACGRGGAEGREKGQGGAAQDVYLLPVLCACAVDGRGGAGLERPDS